MAHLTTTNDSEYHDFNEKLTREQIDSKAAEIVFEEMGYKHRVNTNVQYQKLGIDYALKRNGEEIVYADIKLQYEEYKHNTEMLLEVDNTWVSSGERFKLGWAVDPELVTDLLVDFLLESPETFVMGKRISKSRLGRCFVYDAKKVKDWATKNLTDLENLPAGCYSKRVKNDNMYTTVVIVPRKYLEDLMVHVAIIKNGEIVL